MWAGGAELTGQGAVEVVANPATEEPLAEVPSASPGQVDRAVQAARAALGGWRRTPAGDRGELLQGVAAWLRAHTEELGRLMTLEGGKPLVENTDEVGWTANAFSYYAELGRHERGRVIPSIEEGQLSLVLKEPVGVVATIVPWNYPLLLLAWKVAPALAAGNTVVVKPSPYTPLATLRLAEAFAGFPDGVVNLVTGGAESARPWSSTAAPTWSPSPGRWRPASASAPSAPSRSSGPTWSSAARTPSLSATTST